MKISELPSGSAGITKNDTVPIVQNGTTKRATVGDIVGVRVQSKSIREYASLSAAIDAIGSTPTQLVIDSAVSAGSFSSPTTLHIRVEKGGTLTISGSATISGTLEANGTIAGPGTITTTGTFKHYGTSSGSPSYIINGPFEGSDGSLSGAGAVSGLKYAEPEWFNPNTTPGTTDMSSAVQAAMSAASGGGSVHLKSTYLVGDVSVTAGVKRVYGSGILKGKASMTTAVLILPATLSNCDVSVNIDMSNGGATAIEGSAGASYNTVHDCYLYNFATVTTASRFGILFRAGCNYNKVLNNTIVMDESLSGSYTANGISFYGTALDYGGYFTTPTDPSVPCIGNIIRGNHITYGEVAVDLLGATHSIVSDNVFYKQQTRCIYMATGAHNNLISNNELIGWKSSAVVLGYYVHDNTISGNHIQQIEGYNTHGYAEAAINSVVGCHYNHIIENTIDAFGNYGIYLGVNQTHNVVSKNYIRNYHYAGIALEAEWEESPPVYWCRPNYGAPPSGTQWALGNTEYNAITGNEIGPGDGAHAIVGVFVSQIVPPAGTDVYSQYNTVKGNVVWGFTGSDYPYYWLEETSGYLVNNLFINNNAPGVAISRVFTTRNRAHFSECRGNDAFDTDAVIFTDGDTTPSVGKGGYYSTANTGATSITFFDDGYDGQIIRVKLDTNTTIVNGATIACKDGANILGGTNYIVSLEKRGAVWYEVSRTVKGPLVKYLSNYSSFASAISKIGSTAISLIIDTPASVTDDITVPTTLQITITKGGYFSIDSGKTLTINGPFEAGLYQVFSGSGSVTGLKYSFPEWWGAKDDSGTTDNTTAINAALSCGGVIELKAPSSGYYKTTDALTMSVAGSRLTSNNLAEIRQATSNKGGVNITASNCAVKGIKFTGPQYVSSQSSEIAIRAYGADASNYITDLDISDNDITTWGYYGIRMNFVSDFKVLRNKITNIYYAGVGGLSVSRGSASFNNINNIVATPNAYGVQLTRTTSDSIVTNPRSQDIDIIGNTIRNVTNWEGIDTHAGKRITIIGNKVFACKYGIVATPANNGSSVATWAPLDITIANNVIDSEVTDGTAIYGITLAGAYNGSSVNEYAAGVISGNLIRGYGDESDTLGTSVYLHSTSGAVVSGNEILYPGNSGILMSHNNQGFSLTGNTVIDVWSNTQSDPKGIDFYSANSVGSISGNTFISRDKTATYVNVYAISVANSSGNSVMVGKNYIQGFTYALNDVGDKTISGSLAGAATSGTGEDSLNSTAIPANWLSGTGVVRITAAGTKSGSAGTKTIKFYFGSLSIVVHPAANNTNDWRLDAIVSGSNATNAQKISWVCYDGATVTQGYETASVDTTAASTITLTGTCSDGADTIFQTIWLVERIR
jgi:hypothetical protein